MTLHSQISVAELKTSEEHFGKCWKKLGSKVVKSLNNEVLELSVSANPLMMNERKNLV